MAITREDAMRGVKEMYNEFDQFLSDIVKARLERDEDAERKAFAMVEGTIVGAVQELTCLMNYFEKEASAKAKALDILDDKNINPIILAGGEAASTNYIARLRYTVPGIMTSEKMGPMLQDIIKDTHHAGFLEGGRFTKDTIVERCKEL